MNKRGGFTDLFLFIIIAFVILLVSAVFIYMGGLVSDSLHSSLDTMDIGGDLNVSQQIDSSIGAVNTAYAGLYWISVFLIVGMALGIFIGSYLVTTKPVFFIPYIFITVIAVIVAVGISNAYEELITTPELASTFSGFVGGNYIMAYLPLWVIVIGITGAIIMFSRMGRQEEVGYYG